MNSEYTIVVGGGIAGIFAALMLSRQGRAVKLIEKAPEVGGLLRSQNLFEKDMYFDFGTHLLKETGIKEVDNILFENIETNILHPVKVGVFQNRLYDNNGFINDFSLSEKDRLGCLNELLESNSDTTPEDLESQLIQSFGRGYYEKLLKPVIEKFFYAKPKQLVPDAHHLFGLSRIIVSDPEKTVSLKKSPRLDKVLACHSYNDLISETQVLYPAAGGAGGWINHLENKLIESGVEVLKDCSIVALKTSESKVSQIQTDQGNFLVDELIWTIPPFMLLKLLNAPIAQSSPPTLLSSAIFHFVIDKNYCTDLHYLQCYSTDMKTFRVTLYNNYSPRRDGKYLVSSEVLLSSSNVDMEELSSKVFSELKEMQVIPQSATKLNSSHNLQVNGFPIPTMDFIANSARQNAMAESSCTNIRIFGRGNGRTWFMNDIIADIYQTLRKPS